MILHIVKVVKAAPCHAYRLPRANNHPEPAHGLAVPGHLRNGRSHYSYRLVADQTGTDRRAAGRRPDTKQWDKVVSGRYPASDKRAGGSPVKKSRPGCRGAFTIGLKLDGCRRTARPLTPAIRSRLARQPARQVRWAHPIQAASLPHLTRHFRALPSAPPCSSLGLCRSPAR